MKMPWSEGVCVPPHSTRKQTAPQWVKRARARLYPSAVLHDAAQAVERDTHVAGHEATPQTPAQ